ncbi:chromosomal protein D1-like [Anastrepha obliqua]|uniref:chromosomal protein D1-like n=1 Tax=Anastrepha obliqua TaxID=95512 RepID=UPI002409EA1C|nr:chromosomal protein D1-like [Anastrepha obliqua]
MQRNATKDQQDNSINSDTTTPNSDESKQPPRRGRPRKLGKQKISHSIVSTGKGRGRPKKQHASTDKLGNDAVNDIKGRPTPILPTKRGRPRKEKVYSDSENSSYHEKPDYEERRPVGRPSTGAVNLNIVRTGRGQGRPKKSKQPIRPIAIPAQSNANQPIRKRGRPSKGGVPYERTGKPRGRPKLLNTTLNTSGGQNQEEKN